MILFINQKSNQKATELLTLILFDDKILRLKYLFIICICTCLISISYVSYGNGCYPCYQIIYRNVFLAFPIHSNYRLVYFKWFIVKCINIRRILFLLLFCTYSTIQESKLKPTFGNI